MTHTPVLPTLRKRTSLWTIFFAFLCSCSLTSENQTRQTDQRINWEDQLIERSYNNCDHKDPNCTFIRIQYPSIEDSTYQHINSFIDSIKSPAFDPDEKLWSLDSFANDFINDYSEFLKSNPDVNTPWYVDYTIQMINQSDSLITLRSDLEEFLGGAHSNKAIFYYNLQRKNGGLLSINDLYSDEEVYVISDLLSQAVDKDLNLFAPEIYPNNNFILEKDSITFLYNPYEIAPFSEGVIKITIGRKLPTDQGANHEASAI